jgi:hypothetical protein
VGRQTDNQGSGIKLLFAQASAAATGDAGDDDEDEERRRRRGEMMGELARFRRWSTRRYVSPRKTFRAAGVQKTGRPAKTQTVSAASEIPADMYDRAADFLADTLDSMNPYCEADAIFEGCEGDIGTPQEYVIDRDFDPPENYFSLQL